MSQEATDESADPFQKETVEAENVGFLLKGLEDCWGDGRSGFSADCDSASVLLGGEGGPQRQAVTSIKQLIRQNIPMAISK